jgi:hypothetical protein
MGYSLLIGLIIIPLTGVLLLMWLFTRRNKFGKMLAIVWAGMIGLMLLVSAVRLFKDKKELAQEDIYGEYVIDRTKFSGEQADWQYNHFKFEITRDNRFYFYQTDGNRIVKSYEGTVEFLEEYYTPRIILHVNFPRHHIINEMPTLYRTVWSFYYVFDSPFYGNVFFKKGKWKELN